MSYDPDDAPFADLAAQVALAEPFELTINSPVEFMNPWHDEIGRFAPKGTGRRFGPGGVWEKAIADADAGVVHVPPEYTKDGNVWTRVQHVPRTIEDGHLVMLADAMAAEIEYAGGDPEYLDESFRRRMRKAVMDAADRADPDLVDRLIKPAMRALENGDLEEARSFIGQAVKEVSTTVSESFQVPPAEKIKVTEVDKGRVWQTVTPEGHTITFDSNVYRVTGDQAEKILSAATTAARAGNVKTDVDIVVQAMYNREEGRDEELTMGFVNSDPTGGDNRHRTVHLTPQLIQGNFEQDGITPNTSVQMAAGTMIETIRNTTMHEMGHVSLFEDTFNGDHGNPQSYFNDKMQAMSDAVPADEMVYVSDYGQNNTVEGHAEAFSEWVATGGTTTNPVVRKLATIFGWSDPGTKE